MTKLKYYLIIQDASEVSELEQTLNFEALDDKMEIADIFDTFFLQTPLFKELNAIPANRFPLIVLFYREKSDVKMRIETEYKIYHELIHEFYHGDECKPLDQNSERVVWLSNIFGDESSYNKRTSEMPAEVVEFFATTPYVEDSGLLDLQHAAIILGADYGQYLSLEYDKFVNLHIPMLMRYMKVDFSHDEITISKYREGIRKTKDALVAKFKEELALRSESHQNAINRLTAKYVNEMEGDA